MKYIQITFLIKGGCFFVLFFWFFVFVTTLLANFFLNVSFYIRFEFNPVLAVLFLDSAGALKMYYTHASS